MPRWDLWTSSWALPCGHVPIRLLYCDAPSDSAESPEGLSPTSLAWLVLPACVVSLASVAVSTRAGKRAAAQ